VVLIVRLLAAASVADDRIAFTNGASPQDDVPAACRRFDFRLVRRSRKWDKKNRRSSGLCSGVDLPGSKPEAEPLLLKRKSQLEENNASRQQLLEVRFKGLAGQLTQNFTNSDNLQRTLALQIPPPRGGNKMFGKMHVTEMVPLSKSETVDEAVAKLLEFAEHPEIFRWFQFPSALLVFLAHADSPDSGAVYVYDRKRCVWLWVDFNDQNYGGYSPSEFDVLIEQCHFFQLAESPALLTSPVQWLVTAGQSPEVLGRLPA